MQYILIKIRNMFKWNINCLHLGIWKFLSRYNAVIILITS